MIVYCLRGIGYALKRDYEKAVVDFSEAIRLDPTNPEPFSYRSRAYLSIGEKEKADADLEQAKKLSAKR